jgi:hypothetical protein
LKNGIKETTARAEYLKLAKAYVFEENIHTSFKNMKIDSIIATANTEGDSDGFGSQVTDLS